MGKIKKQKLCKLLYLLTGIITGIIIGTTAITLLISYRVDKYHKSIKNLEIIIEERDMKLKKLEETINKNKFILTDIEVFLIYDGDDIDKLTVEKYIKSKYSKLLGKEVKSIDLDMVADVVDNRILIIDDNEYKLRVNRLLLSQVLKIWATVETIRS